MSEVPSLDSYDSYNATHKERASVFISDDMTASDREAAINMAYDFADKDKPIAKTAVLIPVAAHQDRSYIVPTLAEYAKQKTDTPFTVFLSLNSPFGTGSVGSLSKAEAAVDQARETFPQLDVRSATTFYDEPTIGMIRRELWNAAFLLSHYEHGFSSDVIGINNDIDTQFISPHYVSRIQQLYEKRSEYVRRHLGSAVADTAIQNSSATRVTHAVMPTHPNTGKVTTWIDNSYFQNPDSAGFEAGLVIPFSYYAQKGGFDSNSVTHETSRFSSGQHPYLSGAHIYTSPRRYVERLHQHDTSEIWTNDSFGSDDACRNALPPDISEKRAEEVIFDRLQCDIEAHWLSGSIKSLHDGTQMAELFGESAYSDVVKRQATDGVSKQLSKADRLLRNVITLPLLADIVQENYNAKSYVDEQAASDSSH